MFNKVKGGTREPKKSGNPPSAAMGPPLFKTPIKKKIHNPKQGPLSPNRAKEEKRRIVRSPYTPHSRKVRNQLPIISPVLNEIKRLAEDPAQLTELNGSIKNNRTGFNKRCAKLAETTARYIVKLYSPSIERNVNQTETLHISTTLMQERKMGVSIGTEQGHYIKGLDIFCGGTTLLSSLDKLVSDVQEKSSSYGFTPENQKELLAQLLKLHIILVKNINQLADELVKNGERYNDCKHNANAVEKINKLDLYEQDRILDKMDESGIGKTPSPLKRKREAEENAFSDLYGIDFNLDCGFALGFGIDPGFEAFSLPPSLVVDQHTSELEKLYNFISPKPTAGHPFSPAIQTAMNLSAQQKLAAAAAKQADKENQDQDPNHNGSPNKKQKLGK